MSETLQADLAAHCMRLETELSATQQKLEAAEARIKASQEQKSVAILHPYGDSGWLFLDEYCPPDRKVTRLPIKT